MLACLGRLRQLWHDTAGGTATLFALSLPVTIGALGLAFDVSRGLEQRMLNQRVADMAALGAAMAYKAQANAAILQPTANDIVLANGRQGVSVVASIVQDVPRAGAKAVRVVVTQSVPFTLARVVGMRGSYSVGSTAIASLESPVTFAAPCFLALSADDDALTTQGGAKINAPGCSVAAIGSIDNGGDSITAHDVISGSGDISTGWGAIVAQTLRFAGAFTAPAWNTSVPPADKRINEPTTLVDPWANDADLISARTALGYHVAPPTMSDPDTSCSGAQNWSLEWNPKNGNPAKAWWTGSGYAIPAGNYCIRKLTMDGGLSISFGNGSTISISQGYTGAGGTTVNFGNSDLRVNGGFDTGSSGVTIGDGQLWIGKGTIKFDGTTRKGNGDVVINDLVQLGGGQRFIAGVGDHLLGGIKLAGGGTALFGDGRFSAGSGIDIGGDSELALGDGEVIVGVGSGGNAIKLTGSARLFMGDGPFSANGDIDTAGGSRLVFGQTTNHYINGDLKLAGAVLFGAGRYTINGDVWNGTGGTVWPYTSTLNGRTYGATLGGQSASGFDIVGVNVTLVLAGTMDLAGGARTKLVAARSTGGGALADLLVDSLTTTRLDWTGGSTNVFDGVVHFPNAEIKMAGGNSTSGGGACFSVVANYIRLTGGAVAASACPAMNNAASAPGGPGSIRLVM